VRALVEKHGLKDYINLSGVAPWTILTFKDHPAATKEVIKTAFMVQMFKAGVLIAGSHNICYSHSDMDVAHVRNAYNSVLERIHSELSAGTLGVNLEVPPIYPVFQVRS
jgi:glutamate-1-semialdehyde 2,1-aminomutase